MTHHFWFFTAILNILKLVWFLAPEASSPVRETQYFWFNVSETSHSTFSLIFRYFPYNNDISGVAKGE